MMAEAETKQKVDTSNWSECVFEDHVLEEGFVQIPVCVIRDAGLSSAAVRLYGAILHLAWKHNGRVPGQSDLGEWIGVSRNAVNEGLGCLVRRGYIETKRVGLGKPNQITVKSLADKHGAGTS